MPLNGTCSDTLQPVADAFMQGFTQQRDVGARLTICSADEVLVDVWAGHRDRKRSLAWQDDTLVCCFSISKAITSLCVLQAVDAGILQLDAKVADYWPEYGTNGKQQTTLRQVLCHQAGVPGLRAPQDKTLFYDWQATCTALAAEQPWWLPGSRHGYHARTLGFLLGEILQRASGVSVQQWLQQRICQPLGSEFYFGLNTAQQARCADMLPARVKAGDSNNWPAAMQRMLADFMNTDTPTGAAFQNPNMGPGYMNSAAFRTAVIPAVNGHGTALGVAQIFANLPRLVSADLLAEAAQTQSHGEDQVLKSKTRFGLGFMLYEDESPIGRPGCMGHAGAGGGLAFYDPQQQLAFCFVMNQMQEGVVTGGTSAQACADALYACL